jgi:hypothetical protein
MLPLAFGMAQSSGSTIVIRIQFSDEAPPRNAFTFSGLTHAEVPGEPPDTTMQLDPTLYVEHEFPGPTVQRGLHYGFAWDW